VNIEFKDLDKGEALHLVKHMDYYCALCDITETFRRLHKYTEGNVNTEEVYKSVLESLEDYGVEI
jgi:hypothetical protein